MTGDEVIRVFEDFAEQMQDPKYSTGDRYTLVVVDNASIHKVKDKATGGYFNGPAKSSERNWMIKQQGVTKKQRPKSPKPDHQCYPTMQVLALEMTQEFVDAFPEVRIKGVLADALYGTGEFMDKASAITGKAQVVSQLRSNQKVASRNSEATVKEYFARQEGVETQLIIRGDKSRKVTMLSARLYVKAHNKRRFVIALKYEDEEEYRYLVASDMSWHHVDIARLYSLRWLVEVFIQDWKAHGGWNRLSKQRGEKGSKRGLILSLLCEHLLLLHPEQSVRLKNNQPGMPVGCLIEHLKAEALVDTVKEVVTSGDPESSLESLTQALKNVLPVRESSRHMAGRDLGKQEPTESLKTHARKFELLDAV